MIAERTILVTGGTRGIGRQLVGQLVAQGATVHFCGRSPETVAETMTSVPGALGHVVDLAHGPDRRRLVDDISAAGPIDTLINNAGVGRIVDLTKGPVADPMAEIETNLVAPIDLTLQLLPHLRSASGGAVVNVGSALAYVPMAAEPLYCATKAGFHSWSQSLRHQLAGTGIRVVDVLLPTVDTAMAEPFDVKKVSAADVAAIIIESAWSGREEIRFGQSRLLYALSRVAPRFIFGQLNKHPVNP